MRLRTAFAAAAVVPAIVASSAQTRRAAAPAAAEVDVSRVEGAQVEPAIVVDPSIRATSTSLRAMSGRPSAVASG